MFSFVYQNFGSEFTLTRFSSGWYCSSSALAALDGRPRLRFIPTGTVLADVGAFTKPRRRAMPIVCLQMNS